MGKRLDQKNRDAHNTSPLLLPELAIEDTKECMSFLSLTPHHFDALLELISSP